MFREIKHVRQEQGAGRRRWFESEGLDLIVWLGAAGEIAGFQICYDFGRGEHALTWREGAGITHSKVDHGENTPLKNETPVLVPIGRARWPEIARAFELRAEGLEPELHEFVREKLLVEIGGNPVA